MNAPAVVERVWPHDEPAGWNLDAAAFLTLVQQFPHMWLCLGRAKYIEMRVDTRDGAFNLYDCARQPLSPDDVVAAIEKLKVKFGVEVNALYRAPPSDSEVLASLLPERLARPLLDYAAAERTTARAVISEAVAAYLGFSA